LNSFSLPKALITEMPFKVDLLRPRRGPFVDFFRRSLYCVAGCM